jgi:AcrR family transcriptional regulator
MAERPSKRITAQTQLPEHRPGPAGGKRDQNRRARSQGLLSAAEQLFLARGIEDVSIDDITRAADVAKGSFYRYFPSKEALVRALLADARTRVVSAFEHAEQQLQSATTEAEMNRAYLRLGRELLVVLLGAPNVTRLYLQESRAPGVHARAAVRELEREVAALSLRVTEAAFAHGLLRKTAPQISTLTVIGAAEKLLTAYFEGSLQIEPSAAVQGLVDLVLHGMR